jgi:hypothetical protein
VVDRGELPPGGPECRPTVPTDYPHSHLHDHPGVFGAAVEGRGELPPGGPKFSLPQSCATLPTFGRPLCNSTLDCSPELALATTPGPVSPAVFPITLAGRLEGEDSRNIFVETSFYPYIDASERIDTPGQSSHELPAPSPGPVPNPGIFASLTTLTAGGSSRENFPGPPWIKSAGAVPPTATPTTFRRPRSPSQDLAIYRTVRRISNLPKARLRSFRHLLLRRFVAILI